MPPYTAIAVHRYSIFVAGTDQGKRDFLGDVADQWRTGKRAPQIFGKWRALPHGVDARFGADVTGHAGDISCGKYAGMRHRLQFVVYRDKTERVDPDSAGARPTWRAGSRCPDDVFGMQGCAGFPIQNAALEDR